MAFLKGLIGCVLVISALLHCTAAQTRHVVGGQSLGWTVPPGGAATYTTWAASQTFMVGDTLVFNFVTGTHDVTQVSRANYDACNGTSPISRITTGPASVVINSTGDHYYICTFTGHCPAGQKVTINVTATAPSSPPVAAPTPTPSSPTVPSSPPVASPTPSPSSAPVPSSPPMAGATPSPSSNPAPSSPPVSGPPSPPGSAPTPSSTPASEPPPSVSGNPPSSPTPGSSTPPPPPSSASSLAAGFRVAGLPIVVVSAITFFL
ncbi:early nodulin-like protein 11 [Tasmannia lanceolata]|uniref:early nodulin-like protein 11 n=1 Tax=Tasmannia lanceolata TaxID=3420 RepID=UPI0040637D93